MAPESRVDLRTREAQGEVPYAIRGGGVVRAEVLQFRLSLLGDIDPGHPITDLRS